MDNAAKEGMPRGVLKRLEKLENRRCIQESRAIAAENRVRELEAKLGNGASPSADAGREAK